MIRDKPGGCGLTMITFVSQSVAGSLKLLLVLSRFLVVGAHGVFKAWIRWETFGLQYRQAQARRSGLAPVRPFVSKLVTKPSSPSPLRTGSRRSNHHDRSSSS
jgi:hypothetical protein